MLLTHTDALADRAASLYHKAMALKRTGKKAEAIKTLQMALAEREDYAAVHRSLGILYRQSGNLSQAIYHLQRALDLQPGSADVHYSLGLAYYQSGEKKKALESLEKATRLKPKDAQMAAQYGTMMIRIDPEKALRPLHRAVKLSPKNGDYLHQLGLAYRKASTQAGARRKEALYDRYLKKAEQYLLEASALKDSASLNFDLAVLYRRKEKPFKAIEYLRRAVELDPKLKAAWWDLGHMYKKTKQDEEAVQAFEKYIQLDGGPSAKIARQRIKELKSKK